LLFFSRLFLWRVGPPSLQFSLLSPPSYAEVLFLVVSFTPCIPSWTPFVFPGGSPPTPNSYVSGFQSPPKHFRFLPTAHFKGSLFCTVRPFRIVFLTPEQQYLSPHCSIVPWSAAVSLLFWMTPLFLRLAFPPLVSWNMCHLTPHCPLWHCHRFSRWPTCILFPQ